MRDKKKGGRDAIAKQQDQSHTEEKKPPELGTEASTAMPRSHGDEPVLIFLMTPETEAHR